MIYDQLENLSLYLKEPYKTPIMDFIKNLTVDIPEGLYIINNDKIFAKVMSYPTNLKSNCNIEAHNHYIDIQITLIGGEGIDIFKRTELDEEGEYDVENDVIFFKNNITNSFICSSNNNIPNFFTMIFPWEAHRPQEKIFDYSFVKKIVIKMEVESIESI